MKITAEPKNPIWFKSEKFVSKEVLRTISKVMPVTPYEKTLWGVRIQDVVAHWFIAEDGRYVKISKGDQTVWVKI